MKPGRLIVAGMAAGAIALVAVTPALASGVPLDNTFDNVATAPDEGRGGKPDNAGPPDRPDNPGRPDASPDAGDDDSASNNGNRPENPGNPNAITEGSDADGEGDGEGDAEGNTEITRGNRPADAGRPDDAGPGVRNVPTLPDNASPRAQAAVTAAHQQQSVIQDRVAAIRALDTGPGREEAMNTLMADFAALLISVSDAVQAIEVGGGSLTTADSLVCEDTSATEGDDTGDGDDVAPLDEGEGDTTDEGSDEGSGEADTTCGGEGDGDDTDDGDDDGGDDDIVPLDEGSEDGTDDGTGDEA